MTANSNSEARADVLRIVANVLRERREAIAHLSNEERIQVTLVIRDLNVALFANDSTHDACEFGRACGLGR